jgi:hypothetical protein
MTAFINSCRGLIRNFVGTMPPADMEMDIEDGGKKGLFAQCSFLVIRSAKLGEEEASQVRHP